LMQLDRGKLVMGRYLSILFRKLCESEPAKPMSKRFDREIRMTKFEIRINVQMTNARMTETCVQLVI
jgi:hypothetical protein